MSTDRVLVAFASRNGSTAGVADTIAAELRTAGFAVDCRAVADVGDLEPYGAIVLGSGVFLTRRRSDGGGFIARYAEALRRRAVWLFSAGPIGGADTATPDDPLCDESPVIRVAYAIGARGAATFGSARLRADPNEGGPPSGDPGDLERVRTWARSIASDLHRRRATATAEAPTPALPPARSRGNRGRRRSMFVTR